MIRRLKALHIANAALAAAEPTAIGVYLPNCPACHQAVFVGSPTAAFEPTPEALEQLIDRYEWLAPWHAWCLINALARP